MSTKVNKNFQVNKQFSGESIMNKLPIVEKTPEIAADIMKDLKRLKKIRDNS